MPLNNESEAHVRKANPRLTVFDTGASLEPHLEIDASAGPQKKTGAVDFDDDESTTHLTVTARPSVIEDGTLVLNIDSGLALRLKIVVNHGEVGTIDNDGTWISATSDGSQHYIDTGMPLSHETQ